VFPAGVVCRSQELGELAIRFDDVRHRGLLETSDFRRIVQRPVIVLICSRVIAMNRDYLAGMSTMFVSTGLLMNVLGMVGGYLITWVSRMSVPQRRSLAIEGGMQNAGLGTVLASNHFGPRAAMPAAAFVFICIITASLMAAWWQRHLPQPVLAAEN
jgi:BASS family bile acid:Na+ symporter